MAVPRSVWLAVRESRGRRRCCFVALHTTGRVNAADQAAAHPLDSGEHTEGCEDGQHGYSGANKVVVHGGFSISFVVAGAARMSRSPGYDV